jgi:hypothetical protein
MLTAFLRTHGNDSLRIKRKHELPDHEVARRGRRARHGLAELPQDLVNS